MDDARANNEPIEEPPTGSDQLSEDLPGGDQLTQDAPTEGDDSSTEERRQIS